MTCRVGFHDVDLQREHYKSDWHRYNLKRKIVQLPPVTAENFQERVEAQEKSQETSAAKNVTHYCSICKKTFGNDKALQSHLVSSKHLQAVKATSGKDSNNAAEDVQMEEQKPAVVEEEPPIKKGGKHFPPEENQIPLIKSAPKKMDVDSDEGNDDDGDEWEEVEGNPIPIHCCLFCEKESKDYEKNLVHMSVAHSFFIPDAEYCIDEEGLLTYLGEKVGEGMVCLWCNDHSKQFYTVLAAQVRFHVK